MERFRAEVELAPLLKGEIRIIHMVLERPRFSVDIAGLAEEGAGALGRAWKIDPQRVSLARLEVVEGTRRHRRQPLREELAGERHRRAHRSGFAARPRQDRGEPDPRRPADGRAHRARPLRRRRHRGDESLGDHAALSADAFDRRHAHPRQERAALLQGRRDACRHHAGRRGAAHALGRLSGGRGLRADAAGLHRRGGADRLWRDGAAAGAGRGGRARPAGPAALRYRRQGAADRHRPVARRRRGRAGLGGDGACGAASARPRSCPGLPCPGRSISTRRASSSAAAWCRRWASTSSRRRTAGRSPISPRCCPARPASTSRARCARPGRSPSRATAA